MVRLVIGNKVVRNDEFVKDLPLNHPVPTANRFHLDFDRQRLTELATADK